ncbi:MAG: hypothetical protein AAGH19_11595 [Pseudomonadota bacterium]
MLKLLSTLLPSKLLPSKLLPSTLLPSTLLPRALLLSAFLLSGCMTTPAESPSGDTDWQDLLSSYAGLSDAQQAAALSAAEARFHAAPDDLGRLEYAYLLSDLRPAPSEEDLRKARRLLNELDPQSELAGAAQLLDEKVIERQALLALEAQQRDLEARYQDLSVQLNALEATNQTLQAQYEDLRAKQRQTQDQLDSLKDIEARMIESAPTDTEPLPDTAPAPDLDQNSDLATDQNQNQASDPGPDPVSDPDSDGVQDGGAN